MFDRSRFSDRIMFDTHNVMQTSSSSGAGPPVGVHLDEADVMQQLKAGEVNLGVRACLQPERLRPA